MDAESLIAAGYRLYNCRRGISRYDECRRLYQKAIKDGSGTRLYFIDCWECDFRDTSMDPISYVIEVQFRRDDLHVNVEPLFPPEATVAEVEAFFAAMYDVMGFMPYDF